MKSIIEKHLNASLTRYVDTGKTSIVMKIVNIVPGFGGTFYCGNCLRDSGFVASLRQAGHDAVILPVYLPLAMDGNSILTDIPVFYGAVNIYLKQQFPF
ncbi:MAG: hypothetical protein WCI71_05600, partial [Bacteroidota bacterium]